MELVSSREAVRQSNRKTTSGMMLSPYHVTELQVLKRSELTSDKARGQVGVGVRRAAQAGPDRDWRCLGLKSGVATRQPGMQLGEASRLFSACTMDCCLSRQSYGKNNSSFRVGDQKVNRLNSRRAACWYMSAGSRYSLVVRNRTVGRSTKYGQCGVGAYCLGGCDPQFSFDLKSCAVAPTCSNDDFKFNSLDGIQANTVYLGDASKANWVSEGRPVIYDDSVMLTMAPDTVGTLLASTHYVWYGKITAKMMSSAGNGVVSAFIMMSDVKDEIDFEFVGADLQHVQSNYYWQGVLDYHNSANLSVSNTNQDTHTYEIDWQPDTLTWSVDGNVMRTLKRSDTYNSTTAHYDYPQTPSRIMLSLWPAGLAKNGKGTVDWAGGLIDWNSPDMTNGYYHAQVFEVSVECYDPPPNAQVNGDKSYKYTSLAGTNDTVEITDDSGILASFYATGDNADADPNAKQSQSAGPSATSGSSSEPTGVETVPAAPAPARQPVPRPAVTARTP
ncbi:hypothetical protein FH972_026263 [Carpinus fangiana]|uniref:GH16 domain-containing protein n=1 Tax=Carpinus fangiana TaxID=176857 RepID=A0A5N6L3H1_9ROSI|nr:hypothetical protein FH972_026263 [Carpinus fangiana]